MDMVKFEREKQLNIREHEILKIGTVEDCQSVSLLLAMFLFSFFVIVVCFYYDRIS